jgi:hypothetical protein
MGTTWTKIDPACSDKLWSAITSSADGKKLIATVVGGYIYTAQHLK